VDARGVRGFGAFLDDEQRIELLVAVGVYRTVCPLTWAISSATGT
jgi:hypothetical protein